MMLTDCENIKNCAAQHNKSEKNLIRSECKEMQRRTTNRPHLMNLTSGTSKP